MKKITPKMLRLKIDYLNLVTGSSIARYSRRNGELKSNPGNFHVNSKKAGLSLARVSRNGEDSAILFEGKRFTGVQLFHSVCALIEGINFERDARRKFENRFAFIGFSIALTEYLHFNVYKGELVEVWKTSGTPSDDYTIVKANRFATVHSVTAGFDITHPEEDKDDAEHEFMENYINSCVYCDRAVHRDGLFFSVIGDAKYECSGCEGEGSEMLESEKKDEEDLRNHGR